MIYPSKSAMLKTEKVQLKGVRVDELAQQRIAEKKNNENSFIKSRIKKTLTFCRLESISLNFELPISQSFKQYIAVLQEAANKHKNQIARLTQALKAQPTRKQEQDLKMLEVSHVAKLQKFSEDARRLLLSCSIELVDCKIKLCQQDTTIDVHTVNGLLSRIETLLRSQTKSEKNQIKANDMSNEQLKEQICILEKTVMQLRMMKDGNLVDLETERRLLRQQITHLINENEQMKEEQKIKYEQFLDRMRTMRHATKFTAFLTKYLDSEKELKQLKEEIQKLSLTNDILRDKIQENAEKHKIQKEFLEQRLIQQKDQCDKLCAEIKKKGQSTPSFREDESTSLKSTIDELSQKLLVTETLLQQANSRLKESSKTPSKETLKSLTLSPIIKNSHNLVQILEAYLADMPEALEIFKKYHSDGQNTIKQLKQSITFEKNDKEMTLNWCRRTYQLLKQSRLPQETIQKHLQELGQINQKCRHTKIRELLNQIEMMAGGFEKYERKEIEIQLADYIAALKGRGNAIKEESNEDGSSIALDCRSEAFTDLEEEGVQ